MIANELRIIASCAVITYLCSNLLLMSKIPHPTKKLFNDGNYERERGRTHVAKVRVGSSFPLEHQEENVSETKRTPQRWKDEEGIEKNVPKLQVESDLNHNNGLNNDSSHHQASGHRAGLLQHRINNGSEQISEGLLNKADNYPRIIHVLETRFMQNQPRLLQLAKARLQLFQSICLPTVVQQSAWKSFVWIIRTDPNLEETIKHDLIRMLKESGALNEKQTMSEGAEGEHNIEDKEPSMTYVIGSNQNYILSNITLSPLSSIRPFDIHHMFSSALSQPQSIFAGDISNLQSLLHELTAEQTDKDVYLWTRLDADDGLNLKYMEYIQMQAIRYFLPQFYYGNVANVERTAYEKNGNHQRRSKYKHPDEKEGEENPYNNSPILKEFISPQWTYWCAGRNLDWFITDPFRQPHHLNGTIMPVQHVNVCVTPGVTVAITAGFNPLDVPRLDHDKIISYLRPKGGKRCGRRGLSIINNRHDGNKMEDEDDGSCFHMINGFAFSAVRSRTPTSAGMMGISPDDNQLEIVRKHRKMTTTMWSNLRHEFGVSNESLVEANVYFAKHILDVAEENARGQCTEGHSCKLSSKDLLQQFGDLKLEMAGGYDILP